MQKKTAEMILKQLTASYPNPKMEIGTVAMWLQMLSCFPDVIANQIPSAYISRGEQYLNIGICSQVCDELWQWHIKDMRKKEQKKMALPDHSPSGKNNARDCMKIISDLSEKKITRGEYLLRMEELDRKYPGIGFDRAKMEMEKIYTAKNMDINEPCSGLVEEIGTCLMKGAEIGKQR